MADVVTERRGVPVLVCGEEGARISGVQDALDVIGSAFHRAEVVAVPVGRLDERFFALRTGLAGEILQKFANYRIRLAVVGDVSAYTGASTAFRDLVRECNRGDRAWFVDDLGALDARLG
ncbi:DUF4180 domain-containing protein [Actinacidiphila sp. bgisy160]|uniref:DUF4180 domain-containing protein n=1 Tax=Actinacidiphila sp. bgisy160 TaxID=3413796 RepID=UPI003D71A226